MSLRVHHHLLLLGFGWVGGRLGVGWDGMVGGMAACDWPQTMNHIHT